MLKNAIFILFVRRRYLGGNPKIGGFPPKWMVKIMENPVKMDDLGVPLFSETSILASVNDWPAYNLWFMMVVEPIL